MKTFNDLIFKDHPNNSGLQAVELFPNGYGVSVVRFKIDGINKKRYGSYTDNESEWEVAIIEGTESAWEFYETPITNDVLGHQSNDDVTEVMKRVQLLPTSPNK